MKAPTTYQHAAWEPLLTKMFLSRVDDFQKALINRRIMMFEEKEGCRSQTMDNKWDPSICKGIRCRFKIQGELTKSYSICEDNILQFYSLAAKLGKKQPILVKIVKNLTKLCKKVAGCFKVWRYIKISLYQGSSSEIRNICS